MKGATNSQKYVATYDGVSIHAPMKGATVFFRGSHLGNGRFNPRSHEGSDMTMLQILYVDFEFQSTLP